MEPLHLLVLVIFVSLSSAAATLELLGTVRFATYLRNLLKSQFPNS